MYKMIPNIISPKFWTQTWKELRLILRLMGDSRVSKFWKLLPLLGVGYLLSPIDLIPGFLPIIGQLDDLGLLLLGINLFARIAPEDVALEHKRELGLLEKE